MTFEPSPLVTIMVPNWNGKTLTLQCLRSIASLEYPKDKLEVIVVDNGSTDGSVEAIESAFDSMREQQFHRLIVIPNRRNVGAPAAYNQALRMLDTDCEYVWKLDNDVVLPPNSLIEYLAVIRQWQEKPIGAVAGLIRNGHTGLEEPFGAVMKSGLQRWTRILKFVTLEQFVSTKKPISMLAGSCCLFPRKMFEKVGTFEESYFLYYDDTDLSLRLFKNGYALNVVPTVTYLHFGSASTSSVPSSRLYFWIRNHLLCGHRYFSGFECFLFHIIQVLILPWKIFRIITMYTWKGRVDAVRLIAMGYIDFYRSRWRTIDELTIHKAQTTTGNPHN